MLSEVLGQRTAVEFLTGVIKNNNVAHAYLFYGPPSVGKHTTARAFAKALLCESSDPHKRPCGECRHCHKFRKKVHPDLLEIEPAGAQLKIEQIRQLKKDLRYGPLESKWKVVIVNGADHLAAPAANSFLKLLEEPTPGVVLILLTISATSLLPTIRSRCQPVQFSLLNDQDLTQVLNKSNSLPQEQIAAAVNYSQGMVAEAVLLAQPEVQTLLQELSTNTFSTIFQANSMASKLLEYKDELSGILGAYLKICAEDSRAELSLVLETISSLRYNVNQLLLLETFLLKLGEKRLERVAAR